jgi:hypothetical protein
MATLKDFKKPNINNNNNASLDNFKLPKDTKRGFIKEYDPNTNAFFQALGNLDESALQLGKDIITPLLSPVQTAKDLISLGSSVINLVRPGEQGNEELAKQVGKFFKDRYGGLENIKKTFATDPVGMLSDVSILFTGGAALAPKASATANILNKASKIDPIVGATKLVGGGVNLASKAPSKILGMTTGAGETAISTAFKSGQKGGKVAEDFRNNISGKESVGKVVEDTLESLKTKKAETSKTYVKGKGELNLGSKKVNPEIVSKVADNVVLKKTLGQFELSNKAQTKLKQLNKIIEEWRLDPRNHSLEGLDALKRRIDAEYPQGLKVGDEGRLVSDIRNEIKNIIVKESPDYAKVMNAYEEAIKLEKQLMDELSLNKRANVGTTLRKLQSIMRNNVNTNFGNRLEALKLLDTADGNLMAKLAGQSLNTLTPRGLQSLVPSTALLGGSIAASGGLSPLAVLPSLIAGSPRLMGEAAYYSGVASRPFAAASNAMSKLPSPVRSALKPSNILRSSRAVGLLDRPIDENRSALQNRGLLQ